MLNKTIWNLFFHRAPCSMQLVKEQYGSLTQKKNKKERKKEQQGMQ